MQEPNVPQETVRQWPDDVALAIAAALISAGTNAEAATVEGAKRKARKQKGTDHEKGNEAA